jgi:hypothetical protein
MGGGIGEVELHGVAVGRFVSAGGVHLLEVLVDSYLKLRRLRFIYLSGQRYYLFIVRTALFLTVGYTSLLFFFFKDALHW